MNEPVVGLIVAHSTLSGGLAAAVRQISGVGDDALLALSNEGYGPEGLVQAVQELAGDAPLVLFTDLGSGSCAFAARRISLTRPRTAIVCGVNLPILLDFVFHRHLPLSELVPRLVQKGRDGISGACTEETPHGDRALTR